MHILTAGKARNQDNNYMNTEDYLFGAKGNYFFPVFNRSKKLDFDIVDTLKIENVSNLQKIG